MVKLFTFVIVSRRGDELGSSTHLVQSADFEAAWSFVLDKQYEAFPSADGWEILDQAGHQVSESRLAAGTVNSASRTLVTLAD